MPKTIAATLSPCYWHQKATREHGKVLITSPYFGLILKLAITLDKFRAARQSEYRSIRFMV